MQSSADDPAIEAFEIYIAALVHALRSQGAELEPLSNASTGIANELILEELTAFRDNGWRQVGTPRWEIVELRIVDDKHRRVYTCEHDAATYPVDRSGAVARPYEDAWQAGSFWTVLMDDGTWVVEDFYSADHSCEEFE